MTVLRDSIQSPSTADSVLPSSKSATAPVAKLAQRRPGLLSLFAFFRWSHTGFLALALFSALLVAALNTALPVVLGFVFNAVAGFGAGSLDGESAMRQVTRWCLVLCGMGGGTWLANMLFLSTWIVFGELQASSARDRIFQSLNDKEMEWYDLQSDGVSSLFVQIERQTKELQLATSQVFGFLASETFCSLASLGVALYYSWKLTLVLLATIPVSFGVMSLATRRLEPAIQEQKAQLARASKYAVASVTAIDLVKVFNGYDQEVWQYMQAIRMASKPYLTQAWSNSVQMGYLAFWIVGLFVIGFWYGVSLISQGWSPGSVLTTFYATLNAFQSIEAFLPQWLVLARGMSAGAELGDLAFGMSSRTQPQQKIQGSKRPDTCVGDVEMNSISFAYPSNHGELAIDKSTLYFPAGRTTFIVGRSGSGKSTIGNLLVNFYTPRSGQITIDGYPLQTLDTGWIRSNLTLIQQSSVLFSETFMANVALGHPSPGQVARAQVIAACDSALLQSTLATLPKGLDTIMGHNGHSLSGGQKQRMALARARLRNTSVLILDEVTSGLDQVSKSLVMEALREWRRGKTTIIITHDVSQIQPDDFVYVMDHGRLVQEGPRADLVQDQGGLFASLVASGGGGPETAERWREHESTPPDKSQRPATAPQGNQGNLSPFPASSAAKISRRLSQILRQSWQPSPTPNTASALNPLSAVGVATQYSNLMKERASWNVPATNQEMMQITSAAHRQRRNSENAQHAPKRGGARLRTTDASSRDVSPLRALPAGSDASPARIPCQDTADGPRAASRDQIPSRSFSLGTQRLPTTASRDRTPSIDLLEATGASVQAARVHDADERPRRRWPPSLTSKQQPSDGSDPQATLGQILMTVWPALGCKERTAYVSGICCCLMVAAANPAFSYCFARLLAVTWSDSSSSPANGRYWALILLAVGSTEGVATYFAHYLLEYAGQAWVNSLRIESLKRILHQQHAWFQKPANSAHLVGECIDRNAEEMRNIVGRFLPVAVIVTFMIASSVAWATVVSWKLTLVSLAPGPLVFASLRGFSLVYARWERMCNTAASETSATLTETFLNIRVVRALTAEDTFSRKHRTSADKAYALGVRKAVYSSPLYGCYQAMNFFLIALVFYYGTVMLTVNGEISVDKIVQVINLLLFSIGSAAGLLSSIPQITAARVTAAQMLEFAALPYDTEKGAGGSVRLLSPLPVRMQALSFAYPSSPPTILHRVSLQIDAGTCTCIVGPSGCGKSTLMHLLLGLYTPSTLMSSSLTFGGVPYQEVDMRIMRSRLAFVPQHPFLFPGTVSENILYGLPETSPLRTGRNAEDAAEAVGLHDFVASLPDGYMSLLGEGGLALSGGQAQRINIARALARKPLLLVMDEPTSALDAESAETVRQTVQSVMRASAAKVLQRERATRPTNARLRSRTAPHSTHHAMAIVIVTHSREMMKIADKVLMMSEGSVVEQGSYADLMARRGRLATMMGGGVWLDSGWMSGDGLAASASAEPPMPGRHGFEGFSDVAWA